MSSKVITKWAFLFICIIPPLTVHGQETKTGDKIVGIWALDQEKTLTEEKRLAGEFKKAYPSVQGEQLDECLKQIHNSIQEESLGVKVFAYQFEKDGTGFVYPIISEFEKDSRFSKKFEEMQNGQSYKEKECHPVFLWEEQPGSITVKFHDRQGKELNSTIFKLQNNCLVLNNPRIEISIPNSQDSSNMLKYYYKKITPDNPLATKPFILTPDSIRFKYPSGFIKDGQFYHSSKDETNMLQVTFEPPYFFYCEKKTALSSARKKEQLYEYILDKAEQDFRESEFDDPAKKSIVTLNGLKAGVIEFSGQDLGPAPGLIIGKQYYIVDEIFNILTITVISGSREQLGELEQYVKQELKIKNTWAMSKADILKLEAKSQALQKQRDEEAQKQLQERQRQREIRKKRIEKRREMNK